MEVVGTRSGGGVSEGMRALLDGYKRQHESVLKLQAQIEEEEATYLEETPHGNIIRGWDGFIDAKQPRKDAATKKVKPYTEAEHLFSSCCFYSTLASEPALDLVDPTAVQESSSRRKLSTGAMALSGSSTLASASGRTSAGSSSAAGSAAGTPVSSSSSKLQRSGSMSERKASIGSASASGKGGSSAAAAASSMSASGKASKLKKRKREKLESQESSELDDVLGATEAPQASAGAPSTISSSAPPPPPPPPPAPANSDILDIF